VLPHEYVVGARRLVWQTIRLTEVVSGPPHLSFQIPRCDVPSRFGPAQNPTGTVSARAQRVGTASSDNLVAETARRARKHCWLSGPGRIFMLHPSAKGYQLHGEGTGNKQVTDAASQELQALTDRQVVALVAETRSVK